MRILILVEAYSSQKNPYAMSYVHSRCLEYVKLGIDVEILSFSSKTSYSFEGLNIYSEKDYIINNHIVDIVISHAPNLKNHLRFLLKFKYRKKPLIIFFHGHEVMNINRYYPKAYSFDKVDKIKKMINLIYDPIKLLILKKFILSRIKQKNIRLIFVSKWMKNIAFESMHLKKADRKLFEDISNIVHNGINHVFKELEYDRNLKKIADFITIRPFDDPKYAIDVVYNLAKNNPNYTFHVYGKGKFFDYYPLLDNLKVINQFLLQEKIPHVLNQYKAALMPTRLDAQGVMMCEIASYGMPLITSDIDICTEMLDGMNNVAFISNDLDKTFKITDSIFSMKNDNLTTEESHRFNSCILAEKEIDIIKNLIGDSK